MMPIPLFNFETSTTSWNNSWGPAPDFWYLENENNTILSTWTDLSSDTSGTNNFRYGKSGGSFTTTVFSVIIGGSFGGTRYGYDPIPGDTGPGGGGPFNLGQIVHVFSTSGGDRTIRNPYSYTGTYPSETIPSRIATFSVVSGGDLFISQSINNSTPSISFAKYNGNTKTSSSHSGGSFVSVNTSSWQSLVDITSLNVKEYLVYYSTLSTANRDSVEDYLKNKWGISY